MADNEVQEVKQQPPLADAVLAVASGKGGVGKSTVAVNLALALAEKGKKIGLLDADVYGPNVPLMLGLEKTQAMIKQTKLIPVQKYGLSVMSIGFITDSEKALIWRGPLAHKLITQFLDEVEWGDIDILLIDLPPGTGDVPLSIIQKANLTGAVIVTTPQEASIADVRKMIDMFNSTQTKILGIVENMKYIICHKCSEKMMLYPNRDQRSISEILGNQLLAEFPFETSIGLKGNNGTPFYLANNTSSTAEEYRKLAEKVLAGIK